jgi:hypothetical protein
LKNRKYPKSNLAFATRESLRLRHLLRYFLLPAYHPARARCATIPLAASFFITLVAAIPVTALMVMFIR